MEARTSEWIEEEWRVLYRIPGNKERADKRRVSRRGERKHFIRFCEIIEGERGVCKHRDAKEATTVSEVHEVKNAALHDKREATGGGERERDERLAFKTRSTCTH